MYTWLMLCYITLCTIFYGHCSRTNWVSWYQNKPFLVLLRQEMIEVVMVVVAAVLLLLLVVVVVVVVMTVQNF